MFHHPLELTLELTDCCARARDFDVAVCECLHSKPTHVTFHRPDGTLRAPLFGSQSGGVYVGSSGVANFEGCNIHDNTADYVCLHL